MVFCSECGSENDDSAKFCQECGNQLKDTKPPTKISKYLNYKAIIIGTISFLVIYMLWGVTTYLFTGRYPASTDTSFTLGILIIVVIVGGITGYLTGKNYQKGIYNVLIVGLIWSIFIGYSSFYAFLSTFIIVAIFIVIGSLIGVYLNKANIRI